MAILIAFALNSIETGHVIIFMGSYRLDLSLIATLIMILIIFLVLYYLLNALGGLRKLPNIIKSWFYNYSAKKRQKQLELTMMYYFADEHAKAYKSASRLIESMKDKTNARFLALCIAVETSDKTETTTTKKLYHELNSYGARKYKLIRKIMNQKYNYMDHVASVGDDN